MKKTEDFNSDSEIVKTRGIILSSKSFSGKIDRGSRSEW